VKPYLRGCASLRLVEEWKWRGIPVWEHAGIICAGETYKSVVKMTFAKGAALEDLSGLFNSAHDADERPLITTTCTAAMSSMLSFTPTVMTWETMTSAVFMRRPPMMTPELA
jgi:hypothetical protein